MMLILQILFHFVFTGALAFTMIAFALILATAVFGAIAASTLLWEFHHRDRLSTKQESN
ncbi:hypothetical protein H6F86_21240 [Phormidium sp. FACHB-592]|uniref:Uncharacterized protein n=1 Tax=Stenomitos frigidus AS-A4 TaxID=2933935 RepID=A0ABV0KHF4_9CYAN|nr:hypothetical protein [Phormidium sp. FACHB-592]MBD2076361.1 hypothetical protein [Phormidium sp. FACHB-592]